MLAAGNGSRLGRGPKALLPFRGRTLVEHIAGALLDGGCDSVVVVLGAEADAVRSRCRLDRCTVVDNRDWAAGMASSFKAGIAAAGETDAVLIALVDQPGINPQLVRHLLQAHQPGGITAASYGDGGRPSHPMIFDAVHARRAAALANGDFGARQYLKLHPAIIELIDCTDHGSDADIDTPSELKLLD